MKLKNKDKIFGVIGIFLILVIAWGGYAILVAVWDAFAKLDAKVSVGILTAATTIIVATITVSVGKYFERKKEVESHFREKKIEIYDEFLKEFFKIFLSDDDDEHDEDKLVVFLREWQRKMILWGGADVLTIYIRWKNQLSKLEPNAETMFLTDEFFRAIRKDIGLSNRNLDKGSFIHFLLQSSNLFLEKAKENPKITLSELAIIEEKLKSMHS